VTYKALLNIVNHCSEDTFVTLFMEMVIQMVSLHHFWMEN